MTMTSSNQNLLKAGVGKVDITVEEGELSYGLYPKRVMEHIPPQFREQRVVAGDQPRGAGAYAVPFDRRDRRRLHGRMLRQIEIVVAGEREQTAPVAPDPDAVFARAVDQGPSQ